MDYSTFCIDKEHYESDFNEQNESFYNQPMENRSFVFVNYSKIDSGLSDREDRYFGAITAYNHYDECLDSDGNALSKQDYKAKKL